MTIFEVITLILSIVAIIISIISLSRSSEANKIAMGNLELEVSKAISETTRRIQDISLTAAPILARKSKGNQTAEDNHMLTTIEKTLNCAIEDNLNAYEEACSKYLDKKIDKERFKKNYIISIRQLVEKKEYKKYFDGVTSRYKAILKVYKEWEDLEK